MSLKSVSAEPSLPKEASPRKLSDGIIKLDSQNGRVLGFTSDKFDGWLWKSKGYIYISFIISKHPKQGNLKTLFERITSLGYGIKVPTPFAHMKQILEKNGFKETTEWFKEAKEHVDVWVKEALQQ